MRGDYSQLDLLRHQREALQRFFQKDVPVEKRKYCGIHKELIRSFGLKDHYNIYVEEIPSPEIVQYLAKEAGTSTLDVMASIKASLPTLTLVDEEKTQKIISHLKKHNIFYREEPSGLVVSVGKYKVILQYCDYRVGESEGIDYAKEKAFKRRLLGTSVYESPITKHPKYTDNTLEVPLYVKFRSLVYEDEKKISSTEQEMLFTKIPVPTESFSFIINGVERFVISVRQRPIGVYFLESGDVLEPYECFIDSASVYNHRVIRLKSERKGLYLLFSETNKIPFFDFLKGLGVTDEYLKKHFLNIETGAVKDLVEEEIMLTKSVGEYSPWSVLTKDELSKLPESEEIEYIRYTDNPTIWMSLVKNKILDEDTSLEKTYKVLEKSTLTPTDKKVLHSRIYSWLNSFELDYTGRKLTNDKLKPVFDELGEMPSYDYLNLTLLDVIAAAKYLVHLCDRKKFKDGSRPESDDPLNVGRTRILTFCELLENVLREGLLHCVRSTRERVTKEIYKTFYHRRLP